MKSSCDFLLNHSGTQLHSAELKSELPTAVSYRELTWAELHLKLRTLSEQSREEQLSAVAYCRQPASTVTSGIEPRWDPWPYTRICSMSRLLFFPLLSLFLL
jgi:hypothetical protein